MKSCCLLLPCLTLVAQTNAPTPGVDLSGMKLAFEIMDVLGKDQEPTEEQWSALFETPGYAIMLQKERSPQSFMDCFRLACKPSLAKECEDAIRNPRDWRGRMLAANLPHFQQAIARRSELEAAVRKLESKDLIKDLIPQVAPYTSSGAPQKPVSFAFILFEADARGYTPIVVDLLYYLDQGSKAPHLLAHELHHAWRNQLEAKRLGNSESALWTLKQIMLEGIADRINVAPALSTPEARATFGKDANGKDYLKHLDRCPEIIRAMDAILVQMAKHPAKREALGQELEQMVPRSGHLPGFYMASLIEAQLGRPALIQDQLNPATFFALYNKAAAKEGKAPRFSKEAMAYLNHLGRRFEVFKL